METRTVNLLRRAMGAYTQRTKAISSNLANLDTPGYQRLTVSFEDQLRGERLRAGDASQDAQARMEVEEEAPVLEEELMNLADTQMRTQLSTRALSEHFSLMRTGITGRPQ